MTVLKNVLPPDPCGDSPLKSMICNSLRNVGELILFLLQINHLNKC